jgi:catechol 2,3-dioxygenase-like lactoylglutathione lyase family enzyme
MILKLRHVGIVVKDMEKSLTFYRDLLGFKVISMQEECGQYIEFMLAQAFVQVTTVKMEMPDGNIIELLQFQRPMGPITKHEIFELGISHFALTVDDIEAEYLRLSEAGVGFNSGPILTPDKKHKVCFAWDPDGTYIEFVQALN